jgi:ribosomal protein S18 acetylase RimI-like enzyme
MIHYTDYLIEKMEPAQLDMLVPLFDAYRVFYEQPSDPSSARNYLQERLNNRESVVFLARHKDKGLGFTQLYPSFTSIRMRRLWILYDLYVIPEARRQGIGRALLEKARHFAAESGAHRLELSTAKDNLSAQALYESLGYMRDEDFYFYELLL